MQGPIANAAATYGGIFELRRLADLLCDVAEMKADT